MAKTPNGGSVQDLLEDLRRVRQHADELGLTIVGSLIAMAIIRLTDTPSDPKQGPDHQNDNQNAGAD